MVPKSILDLNGLLEFHVHDSEEENSNVEKITDVLNVNIQSFFLPAIGSWEIKLMGVFSNCSNKIAKMLYN